MYTCANWMHSVCRVGICCRVDAFACCCTDLDNIYLNDEVSNKFSEYNFTFQTHSILSMKKLTVDCNATRRW